MQIAVIVSVTIAFAAVVAAAVVIDHVRVQALRAQERENERRDRVHEKRVNLLLDRLAHANDRPWAGPPDEPDLPPEEDDVDAVLRNESSMLTVSEGVVL